MQKYQSLDRIRVYDFTPFIISQTSSRGADLFLRFFNFATSPASAAGIVFNSSFFRSLYLF